MTPKFLRVSAVVAATALALAAIVLSGQRSGGRTALQAYKAQLCAQGEKLTLAELMRGRDTNANHSQAVLSNATGKIAGVRLSPGTLELMKYVAPQQARVAWLDANPGWKPSTGPPGSWGEFDVEVEGLAPVLQEMREALKDPATDAGPPTAMLWGRRVNFVALRTAAQWLMGAAMNDLRKGDREAALQNVEAIAALSRLNRDEYTLVAQMIRVAISGLGLSSTWEALQAPGWTEPQLARLQRSWESVDLLGALEKGYLGERALGDEIWGLVRATNNPAAWAGLFPPFAGGGPPKSFQDTMRRYVLMPAYKLTSIDQDELLHLQTMQEMVVGVRSLEARHGWPEAKTNFDRVSARVNRAMSGPGSFRYLISAVSIPSFSKASQTVVHRETERQLTIAAIAWKRYELRHGQGPLTLQAMVPEYLAAAPYDPMSGQALVYKLKPDGTYVLYSVGEDGKDNGGDPTPVTPGKFGLWEGRDAVWPEAARAKLNQ